MKSDFPLPVLASLVNAYGKCLVTKDAGNQHNRTNIQLTLSH